MKSCASPICVFADDALFFTRGDVISVKLVLDKFARFSESTGSVANDAKCTVFLGGFGEDVTQEILRLT